MTIISRYIFRQIAAAVLLILVSLTVIVWIAVALRQLDATAGQAQNFWLFFKLTTLALPSLLAFIAPIAMLIAMVHTLNRLNSDSELIITTAGGASPWRLAMPLLALAVLVSGAVGLSSHWIGPAANRHLQTTLVQARQDLIGLLLQPGRFTTPEPRLTIHIRDRAGDGALLGLLIHDGRDEKQVNSYLAERGTLVRQGTAAFLVMENGHIVRRVTDGPGADIVAFQRYVVDINRFEQKADQGLVLRPRDRTTLELLAPDPNDPIWQASPGRFQAELHDRFAAMLYPFTYALIALAFVGQAQTTRQNRTAAVVMAIALGFGVRILSINATNQAVTKPAAVVFQYLIPLLAALAMLVLILRAARPRPARQWPRLPARTGGRLAGPSAATARA
jgi:lipopolysaccharide export system permease protein